MRLRCLCTAAMIPLFLLTSAARAQEEAGQALPAEGQAGTKAQLGEAEAAPGTGEVDMPSDPVASSQASVQFVDPQPQGGAAASAAAASQQADQSSTVPTGNSGQTGQSAQSSSVPASKPASSKVASSIPKASVAAITSSAPASIKPSSQSRNLAASVAQSTQSKGASSSPSSLPLGAQSAKWGDSSVSSSTGSLLASSENPATPLFARENFGYSVPVIPEQSVATLQTISADPLVLLMNLLLALFTTLVAGSSRSLLTSTLPTAPAGVKRFIRRLPLSAAVFLLLMASRGILVPVVGAQGIATSSPSSFLVLFYAGLFFLVSGIVNFVCNNYIATQSDKLERLFLPAHEGETHPWKKSRLILMGFLLLFAVIGAHINAEFSILPLSQPGIALIALLTTIVATYARDGVRYALALSYRWQPWMEANALGVLLAGLSIWMTRALGLSPGYLIGVPALVFIASTAFREREGPFEWAGLVGMIVCAAIAWLLLPLTTHADVIGDLLRLTIVILLETAFFESLPLPYLAGSAVYRWKKGIWAAQCTLASFLALHLLWSPDSTFASLVQAPPRLTYMLLLLGFLVVVLLLVAYCKVRRGFTSLSTSV